MTFAPVVSPYQPINGLTGLGLNNGSLYIGADGSDPQVVPQQCYWDAAGTIPAPQPVPITGGYPMYLGSPARLYTASVYSIRVRDASGVQVFYEAHAVPGANVASGIFATIAAAAAASIPGSVQSLGVTTLGYAAAGDAGGAFYTYSASMPSHPGRFQSADGAWWGLAEPQARPEMFGAVANGSADDTAAIQSAIDYCKAVGTNLYLSAKTYKVTLSLNCTFSDGSTPQFRILGGGKYKSVILHAFPNTENYPVIDMSGNTFGGICDLSVRPSGTSYATCAYLAAKGPSGGGTGNGQAVERCYLQAGRVAGDAVAVFYNVDLSRIVDTAGDSLADAGGGGLSMGIAKPANVTSKFITLSSAPDWTQGYVERCEFTGCAAPALMWMGGSSICITDSYFALTGTGSAKIVEVTSPSGASGNAIFSSGLRTENQSSATGVTALFFTAAANYSVIQATLETKTGDGGFMIGSGSGSLGFCQFSVNSSSAALLNIGDGGLQGCTFVAEGGPTGVGTMTATGIAASWGNIFRGNVPQASLATLFGAKSAGMLIAYSGRQFESKYKFGFAPPIPTVFGRDRIVLEQTVGQTVAYTAGSGAQTIFSDTIRTDGLQLWDSGLPSPHLDYEVSFNVNGFGASGTFAVQLVQGGNTSSLISFTPPTGNVNCKVKARLYTAGSPTVLRADCEVVFGGQTTQFNIANVQSSGISPAIGSSTLNIVATSSANISQAETHVTQVL